MKKSFLKILKNNKYIILTSIVERIFFFATFLIIAREYPTEVYGKLITIFSLANIFIVFFDLGLPILLQRELSAAPEKSSLFFSNVLIINLIIFPIYLLSIFICYKIFYGDIAFYLFLVTIILVYLFSLSNILNKALSGLNDFKSQFKSSLIAKIIAIIIFVIAVYFFKVNLEGLLIILLLMTLLQILILLNILKANNLFKSFHNFDLSKIKSILKLSIPLGLAVVFNFLYDKIDIILISNLADFDSVAFYNVGYGIFKASTLSFSFLFVTGFTRVSYLSKNKKAIKLFFKKYFSLLVYICISLTLILFFGAEYIVNLIYTDKFFNSIIVLKILSFATFGLALNNLAGVILNGLGLFKMNMNITLLGLLINVILNIILIPKYGIQAAAIVTVITEYFIFIGDYFCIRKYLK